MKIFLNFFRFIAVLVLLSACSKNGGSNPTARIQTGKPAVKDPFSGKTKAEILSLKYTKMVVGCKLWSQLTDAVAVDKNKDPDAVQIWKLKEDPSITSSEGPEATIDIPGFDKEKELTFTADVEGQLFSTTLKLQPLVFETVNYTSPNGTQYKMAYSPVFQFTYRYDSSVTLGDGTFASSGSGAGSIIEGVGKASLEATASSAVAGKKYMSLVECMVDTVRKREFDDQFLKIDPK